MSSIGDTHPRNPLPLLVPRTIHSSPSFLAIGGGEQRHLSRPYRYPCGLLSAATTALVSNPATTSHSGRLSAARAKSLFEARSFRDRQIRNSCLCHKHQALRSVTMPCAVEHCETYDFFRARWGRDIAHHLSLVPARRFLSATHATIKGPVMPRQIPCRLPQAAEQRPSRVEFPKAQLPQICLSLPFPMLSHTRPATTMLVDDHLLYHPSWDQPDPKAAELHQPSPLCLRPTVNKRHHWVRILVRRPRSASSRLGVKHCSSKGRSTNRDAGFMERFA
ncbi:hypothetical protein KC334_g56 [Hortaea werneckii]|nr:hypothetical protein KC334_g56 [Hortaea werneckii]KAI7028399.1 hypothetical protein KC355_g58 [Hortaea werneckii]